MFPRSAMYISHKLGVACVRVTQQDNGPKFPNNIRYNRDPAYRLALV